MVRKTKEEAAATREGILDAAVRICTEKGVAQLAFQNIAAAVQLTRGAIYYHFGSKGGLFDALMTERATQPLEAAFQRLGRGTSEDPLHDLRRHLLVVLGAVTSEVRLRQAFELVNLNVDIRDGMDAVRHCHQRAMRTWTIHMEQHIEAAQERGLVRKAVSPHSAALATWTMFYGLIRSWLVDPAGVDLLEQGRCVFDLFFDSLQPEAALQRLDRSESPRLSRHPAHAELLTRR